MFSYSGIINDRDYWLDISGRLAIWYNPKFKNWFIGKEKNIGTRLATIRSIDNSSSTCPYNSKHVWTYWHEDKSFPLENIQLNCTGTKNFQPFQLALKLLSNYLLISQKGRVRYYARGLGMWYFKKRWGDGF